VKLFAVAFGDTKLTAEGLADVNFKGVKLLAADLGDTKPGPVSFGDVDVTGVNVGDVKPPTAEVPFVDGVDAGISAAGFSVVVAAVGVVVVCGVTTFLAQVPPIPLAMKTMSCPPVDVGDVELAAGVWVAFVGKIVQAGAPV
jgi:hypothetical protein